MGIGKLLPLCSEEWGTMISKNGNNSWWKIISSESTWLYSSPSTCKSPSILQVLIIVCHNWSSTKTRLKWYLCSLSPCGIMWFVNLAIMACIWEFALCVNQVTMVSSSSYCLKNTDWYVHFTLFSLCYWNMLSYWLGLVINLP